MNPEDVLEMTLVNVTMYNAVIPCPSDKEEVVDADDPMNADYINSVLGI